MQMIKSLKSSASNVTTYHMIADKLDTAIRNEEKKQRKYSNDHSWPSPDHNPGTDMADFMKKLLRGIEKQRYLFLDVPRFPEILFASEKPEHAECIVPDQTRIIQSLRKRSLV